MKKNDPLLFIIALFLAISILAPAYAADAPVKNILLKTQSSFPLGLLGVNTSLKYVADNIENLSGKTLKMKLYDPGKLVSPLQVLGAVSKGSITAGFAISGYWEGTIPGASIFSAIPFGPEAPEYLAWMYTGNGRKLYQKMYDDAGYNVHVIPLGMFSPESAGWFKKPINKVSDLKGLNIRFYGLGGNVLQKLGASVSLIPGGEIFPAMEKGVIDATEFSFPAVDSMMGFHKVAKYNYFPGWHQQATFLELLINKKAWNKMSVSQQSVLEILCKAATLETMSYMESIQAKALIVDQEQHGVQLDRLSDDILDALKKSWEQVASELSATSPMFRETWEDLRAFRSQYAVWQKIGFLPREK